MQGQLAEDVSESVSLLHSKSLVQHRLASRINHSCLPNSSHLYRPSPAKGFRTIQDISVGEVLLTSYINGVTGLEK